MEEYEYTEHWMQRIVDRLDRLIAIGESLEGQVRLPSEDKSKTFADAKEPAKEPPKKWRILEPGEVVCSSDWVNAKSNPPSEPPDGLGWRPAIVCAGLTVLKSDGCIFARLVSDEPAKESEPAWEPKVGDWVRVTRPENWEKCWSPCWLAEMHQFDGKVGCIERVQGSCRRIRGFVGSDALQYQFHRDWLTPAEPPKPPQPEYREPVLPGDAGKVCEFSDDGNDWTEGKLRGYAGHLWQSVSSEVVGEQYWDRARIKKEP